MKKARVLAVNIIASVVLSVLASWFGLFAFCQYDYYNAFCQRSSIAYPTIGGMAACVVLLLFFIQQYANTQTLLQPKQRKPLPHIISKYSTIFERSVNAIWNVDNKESDLEDYGWVIEFSNNGYPLVVPQAAYYHWLLNVAKTQHQFEVLGLWRNISPLSARQNSGISRKRLDTYIAMLEAVDALEYVNGNVRRLKPSYAIDVWTKVIKRLEVIKPLVKI